MIVANLSYVLHQPPVHSDLSILSIWIGAISFVIVVVIITLAVIAVVSAISWLIDTL
jgi:hypothetical protein